MPKRKPKRINKFRGTRSSGTGGTKNKRGKGNKGGWGNAGLSKHRFTYITKYAPDYFGNSGFVNHGAKKKLEKINLYEIESMIKNEEIQKENDEYKLIFAGKVLGTGNLSYKINVSAICFSKIAIEKIEKNKGKAIPFSNSKE